MRRILSAADARNRLADALRQAESSDLVLITRYREPVAALVGGERLERLERLEDAPGAATTATGAATGAPTGGPSPTPPKRKPPNRRPKPTSKRVWASLAKEPEVVMEEAFAEAAARDPERLREWVVLVDGERHQLRLLRKFQKRYRFRIVLDFFHVLERL